MSACFVNQEVTKAYILAPKRARQCVLWLPRRNLSVCFGSRRPPLSSFGSQQGTLVHVFNPPGGNLNVCFGSERLVKHVFWHLLAPKRKLLLHSGSQEGIFECILGSPRGAYQLVLAPKATFVAFQLTKELQHAFGYFGTHFGSLEVTQVCVLSPKRQLCMHFWLPGGQFGVCFSTAGA